MTTAGLKKQKCLDDLNMSVDRTVRPDSEPSDLVWEGDKFTSVGMWHVDCSAFKILGTELKESLKIHLLSFAVHGRYARGTIRGFAQTLNFALAQYPTKNFDADWILKAITLPSYVVHYGTFRSFFVFWNDRYPSAISTDALQIIARPLPRRRKNKNVLSDDPEKSWLTDLEYDAVLRCVWDNYDRSISDIQTTLIRLLSLQYARRPVQLAQLKIGDFREDNSAPSLGGRRIHFPGAKDGNAEENFRDSKEELHPVADHLWDLFQIQKNNVRKVVAERLNRHLTEEEIAQLPAFITLEQLEKAIQVLTEHYQIDWRASLGHQTLHLSATTLSKIIRWNRNKIGDTYNRVPKPLPPLSHRTERPIRITSTRMRHTRARQLARLGTPRHLLSFWLGHENEHTLESYYDDPAEDARQINEAMREALVPLAMVFTGKLLDNESQANLGDDPENTLEFATNGNLKNVGKCGKHSFCTTTSIPIPCYRCKLFEPLVYAPHEEVLFALLKRQKEEDEMIKIGGSRQLLSPIDLGADIRAVQVCIARCNARKSEIEMRRG